jgi:hypothetical protein
MVGDFQQGKWGNNPNLRRTLTREGSCKLRRFNLWRVYATILDLAGSACKETPFPIVEFDNDLIDERICLLLEYESKFFASCQLTGQLICQLNCPLSRGCHVIPSRGFRCVFHLNQNIEDKPGT